MKVSEVQKVLKTLEVNPGSNNLLVIDRESSGLTMEEIQDVADDLPESIVLTIVVNDIDSIKLIELPKEDDEAA